MANDPIVISWDELKTRKVDQRLREQQAVGRNRAYAGMDADKLPVAAPPKAGLLNNTILVMAALGLLGGLLAWCPGLLGQYQPPEQRAIELVRGVERIEIARRAGRISDSAAAASSELVRGKGAANPYFVALTDPALGPDQRSARWAAVSHRAEVKRFAVDVLGFGFSGMLLAVCLGIAEPLTERNVAGMVRNGATGAVLGLIGGIGVALFVDRVYRAAGGGSADPDASNLRDVLARTCAWGVLGLFLAAGPGLLMRNPKKLLIGLAGGLIGGAIGGALFAPVSGVAGPQVSRLTALLAIGLVAGGGTGLIENAAKTGWLKVTTGLIAGKQFILYRNPTYIGSSPDCQIYLFRDPKVGRRHAALHLVPGGVELEDLPLGTPTRVNDKPVGRVRLRRGDRIAIGGTTFLFQEKTNS